MSSGPPRLNLENDLPEVGEALKEASREASQSHHEFSGDRLNLNLEIIRARITYRKEARRQLPPGMVITTDKIVTLLTCVVLAIVIGGLFLFVRYDKTLQIKKEVLAVSSETIKQQTGNAADVPANMVKVTREKSNPLQAIQLLEGIIEKVPQKQKAALLKQLLLLYWQMDNCKAARRTAFRLKQIGSPLTPAENKELQHCEPNSK